MNLNNLPKDMLVELVSQIKEDTEKEYCDYLITYSFVGETEVHHFTKEEDLKNFLLIYVFENFNVKYVLSKDSDIFQTLNIFRTRKYNEYLEYVRSLKHKYTLEELFNLVEKIEKERQKEGQYDDYPFITHIIKGKIIHISKHV